MDLNIRGKTAIVTGASRGIGRACALELAREGANVCLVATNQAVLESAAAEARARGVEAFGVAADLRELSGCESAVSACVERFGGVDILVNNAGAATMGPILRLDESAIEAALQLKAYGYLRMSRLCISFMQRDGWGRIVNIAGGAGTSPAAGNMPTSLANVFVLNVTRALSDAVSKDGILVNTICPGMTNTDRARDLAFARAEREGRDVEEIVAEMGAATPAGRIAEPDEVARVAAFLASDACSYVHGSSIYMDGGSRRGIP
jgi:3-oxoacyl-[acyl-carrier protein] reductase/bacilysin biosynthesis oxidoreductase BacG